MDNHEFAWPSYFSIGRTGLTLAIIGGDSALPHSHFHPAELEEGNSAACLHQQIPAFIPILAISDFLLPLYLVKAKPHKRHSGPRKDPMEQHSTSAGSSEVEEEIDVGSSTTMEEQPSEENNPQRENKKKHRKHHGNNKDKKKKKKRKGNPQGEDEESSSEGSSAYLTDLGTGYQWWDPDLGPEPTFKVRNQSAQQHRLSLEFLCFGHTIADL